MIFPTKYAILWSRDLESKLSHPDILYFDCTSMNLPGPYTSYSSEIPDHCSNRYNLKGWLCTKCTLTLAYFVSKMEPVDLLPKIGLKLLQCFISASAAFCFDDWYETLKSLHSAFKPSTGIISKINGNSFKLFSK